jgi:Mitochondrial ribosomal protein S25
MQEMKPPTERYQEIHGFDESQARGRPCETLPEYGNIPEVNKEVHNILQTWNEITTELNSLIHHRQLLREEVKTGTKKMVNQFPREANETRKLVEEIRERIKFLSVQIHRLQKKTRKMLRLSPQVAYLQACSEFYLLRQQEEVEGRIAMEQARVFKRDMAPTVNEKELQKEDQVLRQWRATADRYQRMRIDARAGGKGRENVDVPESGDATLLDETAALEDDQDEVTVDEHDDD